jgi:hypothetical protein
MRRRKHLGAKKRSCVNLLFRQRWSWRVHRCESRTLPARPEFLRVARSRRWRPPHRAPATRAARESRGLLRSPAIIPRLPVDSRSLRVVSDRAAHAARSGYPNLRCTSVPLALLPDALTQHCIRLIHSLFPFSSPSHALLLTRARPYCSTGVPAL